MVIKKTALTILTVVMLISLLGCSSQAAQTVPAPQNSTAVSEDIVSAGAPETSEAVSYNTETPEVASSDAPEVTSSDAGTLGDYTVSILDYELTEDYEGNPAMRVYFEFTNNGTDTVSFMFAVGATAFQNGIELGTAIVIGDDVDEDSNTLKEIKPGATITCTKIFVLSDTSPVTVEASELLSFSDDMLTKTFDIAE